MNNLWVLLAARPQLQFVLLNLALVWTSIALMFGGGLLMPYLSAFVIVCAEAPRFFRARTPWRRAAVLYVAFIVFCWSFTVFDFSDHLDEMRSLKDVPQSIAGFMARGFFFVIFGHLYGLPFYPVIFGANLLLFRAVPGDQPVGGTSPQSGKP